MNDILILISHDTLRVNPNAVTEIFTEFWYKQLSQFKIATYIIASNIDRALLVARTIRTIEPTYFPYALFQFSTTTIDPVVCECDVSLERAISFQSHIRHSELRISSHYYRNIEFGSWSNPQAGICDKFTFTAIRENIHIDSIRLCRYILNNIFEYMVHRTSRTIWCSSIILWVWFNAVWLFNYWFETTDKFITVINP